MFNEILITLDGSEHSELALRYGGELARMSGGRVTLLMVIPATDVTDRNLPDQLRERTLAYLEERAQTLRAGAIPKVGTMVRGGPPAQGIIEQAREQRVDVIVMSTLGLGADERYMLGSVALDVLMGAPCPVLMVRINKPEPAQDTAEQLWQWEGGANVG
ncbi:MAG: universal stress protein [Dehalococcoidia bacterium]